jgi:hypothetical protein
VLVFPFGANESMIDDAANGFVEAIGSSSVGSVLSRKLWSNAATTAH